MGEKIVGQREVIDRLVIGLLANESTRLREEGLQRRSRTDAQ
jgi:hypothetical protein